MALRDALQRVLTDYQAAFAESFGEHTLASFIRGELADEVRTYISDMDRYAVKGSPGQGTWARGPWIAILDTVVTRSAMAGFYPVFLFREDMGGVYLSLNQAMTEVRKSCQGPKQAQRTKDALRARANSFRAILGPQVASFPDLSIDLAPSAGTSDTAFYEAGNVCAKYYPSGMLPDEGQLANDVRFIVQLYDDLVRRGADGQELEADAAAEVGELSYEDASRFRFHKRIERNADLVKKVKRAHGARCAVCNLDFEARYGAIGRGYIEAHHLKPLASLSGAKVAMDPVKDFAVLCANCHRMVHRAKCVEDMDKFKLEHFLGEPD